MIGLASLNLERHVLTRTEQLAMLLAETECLSDQKKLGGAVFQMVQQVPRVNRAVPAVPLLSQFPQKVLAAFIVDRPAIVGIDQIESP